ncbi:MAG: hypothetical protein ACK2UO_22055 [Caldilineaceae bacterium]|jgi:hypothetical protein
MDIDFDIGDDTSECALTQCIALALSYHKKKKLNPQDHWNMVASMASQRAVAGR